MSLLYTICHIVNGNPSPALNLNWSGYACPYLSPNQTSPYGPQSGRMCRVPVKIDPDPHIQSIAKSSNHYWGQSWLTYGTQPSEPKLSRNWPDCAGYLGYWCVRTWGAGLTNTSSNSNLVFPRSPIQVLTSSTLLSFSGLPVLGCRVIWLPERERHECLSHNRDIHLGYLNTLLRFLGLLLHVMIFYHIDFSKMICFCTTPGPGQTAALT